MTYTNPPTSFGQMMAPFSADIQKTAQKLRQTIQETHPQVEEKIYGGSKVANALYHFVEPNQVLFGIQPGEKTCKLFIHFFDQLKDIGFCIEGSGKNARHIKFSEPEDIDVSALKAVLDKVWDASGYC